jgi:hypothetical protein
MDIVPQGRMKNPYAGMEMLGKVCLTGKVPEPD